MPANPFTRWLSASRKDALHPGADALVEAWDRVERLVIDVYRRAEADGADEAEWAALRRALDAALPSAGLGPHWAGVLAGGQPVAADPFAELLARPGAASFVGDWRAMQLLPAAREALNRWIVAAGPPA